MNFDLSRVARAGASSVLYVLVLLSIWSIGVMLDRYLYFRRRRSDVKALAGKLAQLLKANQREEAEALLAKDRSDAAAIVRAVLPSYGDGPEAVQQLLAKEIRLQRPRFERGLLFLGTIGNNAPFIGLFGTVLGIVDAFRGLGQSTNAGAMGNVMSSIAEALTATAIGILVALPAVVAFNVFQKKAQDVEENAQALGGIIAAALEARAQHGSNPRPVRHELAREVQA